MSIDELVTQYIAFRQALGARYHSEGYVLRAFCRTVGPQTCVAHVGVEVVTAFLAGAGQVTNTWFGKYKTLQGLFRFAISRGHLSEAPLPATLPQRPPRFVPYIYTRDELRRLLDATPLSRGGSTLVEPHTLRALLLLLYGAGLRVGEALALSVADVDLANAVLVVRHTKFYKSRLVPVGQHLAGVLNEYARRREAAHPRADASSPFFVGRRGAAIEAHTMSDTFRRLTVRAGVRRSDGARYQPRLHDLRHTFAVHRLTAWYRQGADVQRLLYQLSVYLGHTSLAGTQVHLTMTPDLLRQAARRFERYARGEDSHA